MFGLFTKDPLKQLNKKYADLLEKAQQAQRGGDIELYSRLTSESALILAEIEALEKANN